MDETKVIPYTILTEFDIALFQTGKHYRLYEKLGSRCLEVNHRQGVYFAVWAPHAQSVSVTGDFNLWNKSTHKLFPRLDSSGIWEGFIENIGKGTIYKYHIISPQGLALDKGDPYALRWETPPKTASIVWDNWHEWKDASWMETRQKNAGKPQPWSVYEVHLGSWQKLANEANRSLNYNELAHTLVQYVKENHFTHVEFMPVMEHPYFPSWGYQITGYFAPTGRFGTPQDFMGLVEAFHEAGIGVILDWVPSHFPADIHGLYLFDGTHIYNYADPRKGYHQDWKSYIFDYGRPEVRSFLISNALFWLDRYHIDGLRVDAVASMLYLDYSRNDGEWIPNQHGGRENLEAISLLREFNEAVYKYFPGTETIAEESTAYPGVSKPVWEGGLGFGQKWMMGWMHDSLTYFKRQPRYRQWHQNEITFSFSYAFSERFMLPLSHDEVVHLKASILNKMPGNEQERFAQVRALYGLQWMHPGAHLLFMGGEIAQPGEWSHDAGINWEVLQYPLHKGVQQWVKALNQCYVEHAALWYHSFTHHGFEWISGDDVQNSVVCFVRKGKNKTDLVVVVCHFGPEELKEYRIGVPLAGKWREALHSDDQRFGGQTKPLSAPLNTEKQTSHGQEQSLVITLAPLSVQVYVLDGKNAKRRKI